jgi:hypothetical protein
VTVDDAFARVVGRQASEEERARLYRLRDALGLHDNDAFWSIVMALEHYDAFFRQYPAQLAEQTARSIESARAAFAVAAEKEAAQAQRLLSRTVAETSVAIARKLAERPVDLHRVTTLLAAVVAFGALCVNAGYHLATPVRPYWMVQDSTLPTAERAFSMVLSVPAGWMVFSLLIPAAGYGAKVGWEMATHGTAVRRERVVGWSLVAACVFGCIACAVLIAKVT